MNQRFIKSLLQIGYEFDSQILSILLRLQGFIEGIRRHLGCVLLPDRVAVSGWQVRYWLGLAGPEWAGASELGCEGGPRGGGRKRKKEWSGRGRGPRGFGILKFFFPIFLIGFKNQNEFESEWILLEPWTKTLNQFKIKCRRHENATKNFNLENILLRK
jgi:hypothetical protein